MLRGVRSWLRATIPRLASSASPKVGAEAEGLTRASLWYVSFRDSRTKRGVRFFNLRVRNATAVRGRGVDWGVADGCVAGRCETAHGRSGGVGGGLVEGGARDLVLHSHYLWAVAGGRVGAARHH